MVKRLKLFVNRRLCKNSSRVSRVLKKAHKEEVSEMQSYALITGATSGIGLALTKIFWDKGYSLILVGRNKHKLAALEKQLKGERTDLKVVICKQDLSQAGAGAALYLWIKQQQLSVDILINNAGAGYVGEFCECSATKIEELMTLNMTSLTELTYEFAKEMKRRRRGKILNVASTGSYHPGAYTAVYYATKAYVLSLSEALYKELKPYGVTVSSLCPGATATQFAKSAGRVDAGFAMSAEFVAKKAFEGLQKGKKVIIPGIQNKLLIKVPRSIAAYFVARYQQKLKA